jgi:hypothetical protein
MKSLAYLALLLAACGVDDRPLTIEVVTAQVLAPSCGAAQCHAAFSQNRQYGLDTVESARFAMVNDQASFGALLSFESNSYSPAAPETSQLMVSILTDVPNIGRMPYDAPLPQADIALLERWIRAKAPGAQCNPANLLVCDDTKITTCNDWFFGNEVADCATLPNASGCQRIAKEASCNCKTGFGDCNNDFRDGCETALNVDGNCGACGVTCAAPKTCKPMGMVFSCQ